jgi:predicted small metal-binding protein
VKAEEIINEYWRLSDKKEIVKYYFVCNRDTDLTGCGGCGREFSAASVNEVTDDVVAHFHADHGFVQIEAYSKKGLDYFCEKIASFVSYR